MASLNTRRRKPATSGDTPAPAKRQRKKAEPTPVKPADTKTETPKSTPAAPPARIEDGISEWL